MVSPELHAPTDRPDVRLHLLASEAQPLKHWSPVHVHLGAAHVMGRVALLEGDRLAPGGTALAQLVLEDKIGALSGDRVILRDPSATRTVAGAVVIDPFGPPRNRRSERRLAELRALGEGDADVLPKLLRLESGFVETGRFGLARNLRPVDVDRLLQAAGGAKLEGFGFLAETLAAARKDIVETLAAHHQDKPDAPGLQPERLRVTLKKRWPAPVFKALLDQEVRAKTVMVDGPFLRLPGHSLTLGARDEALWKKISAELARERFKPPRVRDFASAHSVPEPEMRKLLQRLAKVGRVVEVAPDQYFLRPVVAEMIGIAHAHRPRLHRCRVSRQARQRPQGRDPDPGILRPSRHHHPPRRFAAHGAAEAGAVRTPSSPLQTGDSVQVLGNDPRRRGSAPGGAAGLQSQRGPLAGS